MDKYYIVKNRSAGMLVYSIPELNVTREFAPGESKKISFKELEQLSYQMGGKELMAEYLIVEKEIQEKLNIQTELEYNFTEEDVINLIKNGSMDEWLDCLDFAPTGVIDLIKRFSVDLPLGDYNKRQALKEKLGFDVDKAIENNADEIAKHQTAESAKPKRRVAAPAQENTRRATANKYKVVGEDTK